MTDDRIILLAYGSDVFIYSTDRHDEAEDVAAVVEVTGLDVTLRRIPETAWPAVREALEECAPTVNIHDMREVADQ